MWFLFPSPFLFSRAWTSAVAPAQSIGRFKHAPLNSRHARVKGYSFPEAAKPYFMKDLQNYVIPLLMTPKYLTGI
jgi:hypothetical protein